MLVTYMNDELWLEAKKVAKQNKLSNNWLEIIEYYHSIGGHKAIVHAIIDDVQREILNILDDDTVLMMDSRGTLHVAPYDEVLSSKKLFFYKTTDTYEEIELSIPQGATYGGKNKISIKVV